MTLWLVGQDRDKHWEFQGIFDSQQKAIDACRNKNYWYTEVHLNKCEVDEYIVFDSVVYPVKAVV